MTADRSPTRLLPLLGCALAMAAALALSACGGGGAATAESPQPRQPAAAAVGGRQQCPKKIGAFVDSLDRLRRQLAIGLSYEQYAAKIKALDTSYDRLPIVRLDIDCLRTTGTSAEKAFNKYIDAANAWGECLADASCDTATVEPVLQRKWRFASNLLSKAR